MDMRSLIHQGSSPSSSNAAPASVATSSSSNSFPTSSALPAPSFAMRPQPTIFQRSAPSTQAPTLAPLRFIIPSSRTGGASFPHNGAGLTASVSTSQQQQQQSMFALNSEPEHEPQPLPQHSMLYPHDRYTMKTEQQQMEPTDDQTQHKKMGPKRARTPKLSSRSTKSKARPGLRKGKWTEEESRYAGQLTNYFKEGLLPLERGTMLRLYLSQKLNCEPMRITKKFTGGECIGKQVFRPCSPTPESRVRIMQAQLELVTLESAFIKRLKENREDPPVPTDEFDVRSPSSSGHRRPVPLKPRMHQAGGDQEGEVDDANAVGLLLDFFYKANRNEKKGGKKLSGKGKASKSSNASKDEKKEEGQKQDQIKKEAVETSAPASPSTTTTHNENDTSISSPTKRMRALSVSGYVDSAATKRSRVDSFSTVAAA